MEDIIKDHYLHKSKYEKIRPYNVRLPYWLLAEEKPYPPIEIEWLIRIRKIHLYSIADYYMSDPYVRQIFSKRM